MRLFKRFTEKQHSPPIPPEITGGPAEELSRSNLCISYFFEHDCKFRTEKECELFSHAPGHMHVEGRIHLSVVLGGRGGVGGLSRCSAWLNSATHRIEPPQSLCSKMAGCEGFRNRPV